MAKEYGKQPIDIIFPDGQYSTFESQTFNMFIMNAGVKKDNELAKLNAMKYKRR